MNANRARYLLVLFGLLFITLIGYMTYFEINFTEKYVESKHENERLAQQQQQSYTKRGSILDRNGEILAYSEKNTINNSDGSKTYEYLRKYPHNALYTGVVGYISKYNEQNNAINLENYLHNYLMTPSAEEKNEDGYLIGSDITLTLDHNLQKVAYDELKDNMGAVVAMNPKTGEIYALVSKPSQDANNIVISPDDNKTKSHYSRPIQVSYAPGSTYKIVTAAAILEEGLENIKFDDTTGNYLEVSNDSGSGYGETNLKKGFTVSSNAYFSYMSAEHLGHKKVKEMAERFGLNKNLNEIFDFELPISQGNFQKSKMYDRDIAIASIGQGETAVTPLHLALIASTVANKGVMPSPYLVSKINGEKVKHDNAGEQIINSKIADDLKELMYFVTEGCTVDGIWCKGTGSKASLSEYDIKVCGKTGTAEVENNEKSNAVYVGFAPYDKPEIVVAVFVENAGYGGSFAAPIAQKVMMEYFGLN